MEFITELTARLNRIRRKPSRAPSPAAPKLVEEHVRRERIVLEYLIRKTGKPPGEAHTFSLTEGDDPAFAEAILDALSEKVDFTAAGVRESLYLTIVAYCCWNFDRELSRFENPWSRCSNRRKWVTWSDSTSRTTAGVCI